MSLVITRNQTPTFFATLVGADGALFDVDDFLSGTYTVYQSSVYLTSRVPSKFLTPVAGFEDVEIPVSAIVPATTVNALNLGYNFRFVPNAGTLSPFADVGIYFVEFRILPQAGNPIVWQRTIEVI